jgi:hypothetical protein
MEEIMHEEFARVSMNEKVARYMAEAREPRIKLPTFKRGKARPTRKVGALHPDASG